ncbi:cyclin dependent kinase-binding protein, putative [Trypanosoma vivax Y486]|uniref:Cyclin dependent kinase-binding protein, putative n=1 Tax=Trypanosoma vivax (strain Y486) TaxID=1055687 RepID=F9WT39_TRYVY|nr:cyclin dependent kinase-binding protein, putative [Trypanosoma vivax Y486]|eukprot:CCD20728.1 cyclin dependent kinase-binding protein, putative [Trypanosoma vivax Y486]
MTDVGSAVTNVPGLNGHYLTGIQLARATSFLKGIHWNARPSCGNSSSSCTSETEASKGIYLSVSQNRQSLCRSMNSPSPKPLLTDDVGFHEQQKEHLAEGSESCHELGKSFLMPNTHVRQIAFFTNIGQMSQQASIAKKNIARRQEDPNNSFFTRTGSLPLNQHGTQFSVDTLVSAEGQRVRMHLVPVMSHRSVEGAPKSQMRECYPKQEAAASLCTILSSFKPHKASYWEDDHLVEPYHGECLRPATRGPHCRGSDGTSGSAAAAAEVDEEVAGSLAAAAEYDGFCDGDEPVGEGDNNANHMNSCREADCVPCCEDEAMRSYGKMLTQDRCKNDAVFHDAFFLDTGNITGGERRKKLVVLHSFRSSVISFVDKKVLKKDINNDFYVQHPELEVREIKLTHIRAIRADLLNIALEESSPIEVATTAYANWYFERLVCRGMVGKRNRRLAFAACLLLAVKFVETGDIHKKINYVKSLLRHNEAFSGVTWPKVQQWEFRAYVGLEFTLLPEIGSQVIETHLERLLAQVNLTSQEYYSKKFKWP